MRDRIMAQARKAGTRKPAISGTIRARIDPALRARAEKILNNLGLNASDAIRLFYTQVTLSKGLPFEVKIPNAQTRKAIRDADAGKVTRYRSAAEMFETLGLGSSSERPRRS
jgi:DNA-damage-inducible protein J